MTKLTDKELGDIVCGANRRAVLCDYCEGCGYVHDLATLLFPATTFSRSHKTKLAGIEPCDECQPCPECGRDGCGPGVRWAEVTP